MFGEGTYLPGRILDHLEHPAAKVHPELGELLRRVKPVRDVIPSGPERHGPLVAESREAGSDHFHQGLMGALGEL